VRRDRPPGPLRRAGHPAAACFFDTSALVKRYAKEDGTERVLALTASGAPVYIARITAVELVSALSREWRAAPGLNEKAGQAIGLFRGDYEANRFVIVEIDAEVIGIAMELAETRGLRGYDAIQLASALRVHRARAMMGAPAMVLVCADGELSAAAVSEGLAVETLAGGP
jgi:predicted nucleic acid-binding protein